MINVENIPTLYIGRTGENEVESYPFDFSVWANKYGQGDILLALKRPCDEVPYPVHLKVEGNVATWTVASVDVSIKGTGVAEFVYKVGGKVKKSAKFKVYVEDSLEDATGEPVDKQTWLSAMEEKVLQAEGNAKLSESYAKGGTGVRVDEETDNAKYYYELAKEVASGSGASYNNLLDKPKINNVELMGNKTLEELGIQPKGNYLTEHQSLAEYAKKTELPTKTSELTNDSGYLTAHQDISGKVDKVVQTQKDAEQDTAIQKNSDDIFNNYIKPQAKGNPIVLKDSADFKAVELEINGSTSQVQTSGKNLLDKSKAELTTSQTLNFYIKDGFKLLANKIYCLSVSKKCSGLYFVDKKTNKSLSTSYGDNFITYTPQEDIDAYFQVFEKDGISKDLKCQLELNSQPTSYEPYTGGKPSPSPEYPQEIVNGVIDNITWGNGADITFNGTIPPIELSKWDKIKKIDGVWKKENCTTHYPSYNSEPITTGYYSTTGELSIGAEVYCRKESTYEILPPETQEVLNKIQTFYPNSTIQTNDGIELNLKYIADTKNYVDGQIAEKVAELNKSIVNTQALALER